MLALVLEKREQISIRDVILEEKVGPKEVKIALHTVGVCGSDIHYYTNGSIGQFVVEKPMILGHEASGTVIEVGEGVSHLALGDRVCMEPGIPDPMSKASLLGMYNLDPNVVFWATPPVHGVTRETVVHPAAFTFKIPESVSYGEAAMVEPLAVGMHAANKARVRPGDFAVVTGAGTIGMVTALAALSAGCSRVLVTDVQDARLDIIGKYPSIETVNVAKQDARARILELTDGWGANLVFEASGSPGAISQVFDLLCPGGCVVLIGIPIEPISLDVPGAQVKEARVESVFRYANVYPRALDLLQSGAIDLAPLITETFSFAESVEAYNYAVKPKATSVKIQIQIAEG